MNNRALAAESLEPRLLFALGTNYVDVIDNPYMPLFPGTTYIYRGADEKGNSLRSRLTVTDETRQIMGVTTTLVRNRQYLNGELVQDSRDFYAQDADGNVLQFGKDNRQLQSGRVISTTGSWEAGVNGALATIAMPAQPGAALNQPNVLARQQKIKSPFATFADCVRTSELSPLKSGGSEQNFYAPGIGRVMSQSASGATVLRLAYIDLLPQAYDSKIDNAYFPLVPGTTLFYRGSIDGEPFRRRMTITHEKKLINGVPTTVVRDQEYVSGELVEVTLDWYAQDKMGNVWYFGEDSRQFEGGALVSTEGSWQAGVDGARPGIIMRAVQRAGDAQRKEDAPGVAEDYSIVLGTQNRASVPYGSFSDCLVTQDISPLDNNEVENKTYAPDVGLIMELTIEGDDDHLKLAYVVVEE